MNQLVYEAPQSAAYIQLVDEARTHSGTLFSRPLLCVVGPA